MQKLKPQIAILGTDVPVDLDQVTFISPVAPPNFRCQKRTNPREGIETFLVAKASSSKMIGSEKNESP